MKIVDYKKLAKLPADTLFATINRMNELGEVLVIGQYPDGRRFIYSPLADVSAAGNREIDFDENAFNRSGSFVVFERAEIQRMCEKFMGIVSFQELAPTDHLSILKPEVKASIEKMQSVSELVPLIPIFSAESARHFVDPSLVAPTDVELDGEQFRTAPLAIDARFSLLAISQTRPLLQTGILDITDSLDPNISLSRIYLHLERAGQPDEVIPVTVDELPTTQAHFSAKGTYKVLDLNFYAPVPLVAGALTAQDKSSDILTHGWVPTISVYGQINLETGETFIRAQRVESFMQDERLVRIKVIGYKLKARRVNHNRRAVRAA